MMAMSYFTAFGKAEGSNVTTARLVLLMRCAEMISAYSQRSHSKISSLESSGSTVITPLVVLGRCGDFLTSTGIDMHLPFCLRGDAPRKHFFFNIISKVMKLWS